MTVWSLYSFVSHVLCPSIFKILSYQKWNKYYVGLSPTLQKNIGYPFSLHILGKTYSFWNLKSRYLFISYLHDRRFGSDTVITPAFTGLLINIPTKNSNYSNFSLGYLSELTIKFFEREFGACIGWLGLHYNLRYC